MDVLRVRKKGKIYIHKLPFWDIIHSNIVLCVLSFSESHELAISGEGNTYSHDFLKVGITFVDEFGMLDVVDGFINQRVDGQSHLIVAKGQDMATIRAPAGIEKPKDRVLNLARPVFFIYCSCFDSVFLPHTGKDILRVWGEFEVGYEVWEGEDLDICELGSIFNLDVRGREENFTMTLVPLVRATRVLSGEKIAF